MLMKKVLNAVKTNVETNLDDGKIDSKDSGLDEKDTKSVASPPIVKRNLKIF